MFKKLQTKRLYILYFCEKDTDPLYEYVSDPTVMKYIPGGVLSKTQTVEFIAKHCGDDAESFPVFTIGDSQLIGHIVFHRYFGDHTWEIGWVFNKKYYGMGYASEAAAAVVDYAFITMKLHRIIATCQPENIGSYRVMEKIGMRREGFFRKCIPADDGWWDEYVYSILEDDWEKR